MMRLKFTIPVIAVCVMLSLMSSCKKDEPNDENPNIPGQNDTLSGQWEAITGNIYGTTPAGTIFEVNGTVINIAQPAQPYGGRAFKLQGNTFIPIFECDDNGFLLSQKQKGNAEVYVIEEQISSSGGLGAVYDYEYQLYRIDQNGGTAVCKVPNTDNLNMGFYQLWTENNEIYWGGTSNTSGQISFRAYKLVADTFQLIYNQAYEAEATLIDAANGTYLLSYDLNNGNYSNYYVRKFSGGQLTSIYTGNGSQLQPVVFGNRFYGLETFFNYQDYTASYVKLVDIQNQTKYTIALQKTYVKLIKNRKDALYISVAYSNNTTDHNYVIVDENGIRILPEAVSNLSEIEQRFMRIVEFTESPTHYYRLSENAGELVLLRLSK